jgi:PRTRC genetic system protein D
MPVDGASQAHGPSTANPGNFGLPGLTWSTTMTKNLVIAAIDAGTGFTKYSKPRPGRHADIEVFPSLMDIVFHDSRSSSLGSPRRNALIPFGDHLVEVGPDIEAALGDAIFHAHAKGFVSTDDYRACVAGALAFLEEPFIDMLVLTVPMRKRDAQEQQIRDWLSRPVRTAANTSVTVARVVVLPQPTASAIEWLESPAIDKAQVSLVLVAGYGSLDWALYCGRDVEPLVGGTDHHGVAHLLRAVGERIGQGVISGDGQLASIDQALRQGKSLRARGHLHDLQIYWPWIHGRARRMLYGIADALAELPTPQAVWLAGGGAAYFLQAMEGLFDRQAVHVAPEPMHACVRGMCMYGKRRLMADLDALRA